jgi:hypothetical protein
MTTRLFAVIPVAALFVLIGCDFQFLRDRTPPPAAELEGKPPLYDDRQLTQIWNDIASVVDTEARRPADCKSIPIGAKPCGGPWSYLVYSSSTTNETRLRSLIAQFNERQANLNRRLGMASDCMYVGAPQAVLEGRYCVRASRSHE